MIYICCGHVFCTSFRYSNGIQKYNAGNQNISFAAVPLIHVGNESPSFAAVLLIHGSKESFAAVYYRELGVSVKRVTISSTNE